MSQKQNKTTSSEHELPNELGAVVWAWFEYNRYYTNWRTTDEKDQWTAKDFHLVTPQNSAGSMAMEITLLVSQIMIRVQARDAHRDKLIEARARLDELRKWRRMLERMAAYIDEPDCLAEFNERIAELEAEIKRLEGEGE